MTPRLLLPLVLLSLVAHAAGAQMLPPISGPKNAAARVAAAANARTAAQTNDPDLAARARAQAAAIPPKGAGVNAPATTAAKPNLAPAAKPGTAPRGAAPARAGAASANPVATGAIAPAAAAGGTASVTARGAKSEVAFSREVFSYDQGGRRDPFLSLLLSGDLRPAMNDLRLVAVAYDPTGRNSVAIMRDVTTKDQYRAKVGQTLGRMRVLEIQPKMIVFSIEEFGMNRREELVLVRDSTRVR